MKPGTYEIGPQTGALLLRTAREGAASRVGHDLTITFDRWTGGVVIGATPADVHVEVTIAMDSFHVLDGSGGVTPLTPIDRRAITRTARELLDIAAHPQATFTSTRAVPSSSGEDGSIEGTLTLRGRSTPVVLAVTRSSATAWHMESSLLQSGVGIKPYRAFFGALRVADRVSITADVMLIP